MNIFSRISHAINRQTVVAFILGSILVVGAGAFAVDRHMGHSEGAHLKHLYSQVDATEAQKARIDPLVKAAMADLKPMHEQLHQLHKQLIEQGTQATIDRAALEATRAQGIALADKASRRLVQLIADVGDTLTPAQRQKLAEHLGKMHGGRRHGGL
jgi:Spy/CpxP family protein refolding chaperone